MTDDQSNEVAAAFIAASLRNLIRMTEAHKDLETGVGVIGTSQDYLDNLADHFVVLGIPDDTLFKLQDRASQIVSRSEAG